MPLWHWTKSHLKKLAALEDTPEAIARGVAIGLFFGFTPLFGLKTLLALLVTWLARGNLTSAAIAVSLHDLALPLMPVIYRVEYDLGYWLLHQPHQLPPRLHYHHLSPHQWLSWTTFVSSGIPLLIGAVIVGLPVALVSYWIAHRAVHRQRKPGPAPNPG